MSARPGTPGRPASPGGGGLASRLAGVALLASVYLLTLASLEPLDILAAVAISAALVAGLRRFMLPGPPLRAGEVARRALALPRYLLAVAGEVAVGTWGVALVVTGLRPLARPGIVAVPIGERSPTGVAAAGLAISLSPGELVIDVDWDRGVMLVHVIDAADPDRIREHHARFYERHQRRVFP